MVDQNDIEDAQSGGRLKQFRLAVKMVNQQNKKALPIVVGAAIGIIAVFAVIGLLVGLIWALLPLGVVFGVMTGMILFGRFAQQASYAMIDGQLGAAVAVMERMRGGWTVTPAVNGNRTMDVVHRAVGKPGVILVGEGVPARVAQLIAAEKKKTERVAHGVPIHEFQVGNADGQLKVSKLERKLTTLPRALKPQAVSDLNYRLKALQPSMQMPKGPLPKGARMPKMPKQQR